MQIPRWIRHLPFVTPARRLAWFPPYRKMSVRVLALSEDWRHARILLPLNRFNRNPGGSMFGGAVASLADPIPALACNRVFPGYQQWTRHLELDYLREGRSDLELRFDFDPEIEAQIRQQLAERGRSTPRFKYGFYDARGRLCVRVQNSVAIRPMGYVPRKDDHHE